MMKSRALGLTIAAGIFRLLASSTAHAKQFPSPMLRIVSSRRSRKMFRTRTPTREPFSPWNSRKSPRTGDSTYVRAPACTSLIPTGALASDSALLTATPARPWRRTLLLPSGACAGGAPLGNPPLLRFPCSPFLFSPRRGQLGLASRAEAVRAHAGARLGRATPEALERPQASLLRALAHGRAHARALRASPGPPAGQRRLPVGCRAAVRRPAARLPRLMRQHSLSFCSPP